MTTIREEPIDQDAADESAQHNTRPRRQPLDERGSDPAQHSGEVTLAIEYVPPASLAGYHRNARRHSKRQIAQIAESIRAFDFVSPLLVDKAGEIIAGHGRLAAARQLGRATVPVVRIEHLDEAQKRALRLADNKLAELAGWDETLLALEFSDLLKLDLTLDHVKNRHQFGRPIGSFQAVKHKAADMYVAIERARALSFFAALTIAELDDRRPLAVSMAKAAAGECQRVVFQHGLQLFGAMGYTWENDLQFALRRAKFGALVFGRASDHRHRIAREVLAG